MLLASLTIAMAASAAACTELDSVEHEWMDTGYRVSAVLPQEQEKVAMIAETGVLKEITGTEAAAMSGDQALASGKYHYLTMAGYFGYWNIGEPRYSGPAGFRLFVDVDSKLIAYVSTFALTDATDRVPFAVVLAGDVELKGVIAICGATR